MSATKKKTKLPKYQGSEWIRDGLPTREEPWHLGIHQSIGKDRANHHALSEVLQQAVSHSPWKWPKQPIYFVADPHADAEAFIASLVASGGIAKIGPTEFDIKLTKKGRKATFIIGGDCLDKGPSSLQLLRSICNLKKLGARIKLLAGNHDIRLLMGVRVISMKKDPRTEHLFIRMGPKVIPLLKEVYTQYLDGKDKLRSIPGKQECRRKLYPSKHWFKDFPKKAVWLIPDRLIKRELARMLEKMDSFEANCRDVGLSIRQAYAAALKCEELFLKRGGEFAWFFDDMELLSHEGSFLFIHAGIDDRITSQIEKKSLKHLNRLFRQEINRDLFEFYYGPLGNTIRTKYRDIDMPLTRHGVKALYRQGVKAIVHGHNIRTHGQRIMLRQGMIHIESNTVMDRNSRKKQKLDGYGIGVTIIRPEGQIIGISNDYGYAKVFEPETYIKSNAR
jgi:hypothetical protein